MDGLSLVCSPHALLIGALHLTSRRLSLARLTRISNSASNLWDTKLTRNNMCIIGAEPCFASDYRKVFQSDPNETKSTKTKVMRFANHWRTSRISDLAHNSSNSKFIAGATKRNHSLSVVHKTTSIPHREDNPCKQ